MFLVNVCIKTHATVSLLVFPSVCMSILLTLSHSVSVSLSLCQHTCVYIYIYAYIYIVVGKTIDRLIDIVEPTSVLMFGSLFIYIYIYRM